MADIKISNLVNLAAAADDDELVIVDVSTGITKKIEALDLVNTAHTHDGETLQIDGINSNGGAFTFTTSGKVTFTHDIGTNTDIYLLDTKSIGIGPALERLEFYAAGYAAFMGCNLLIGDTIARVIDGVTPALEVTGVNAVTAGLSIQCFSANDIPPFLFLGKSRGIIGAFDKVADNDLLGQISFMGTDDTDMAAVGASIFARVDGAPANNNVPAELVFSTNPGGGNAAIEHMFLDKDGNLGIGILVALAGKCHIDQASTSAAIPVLVLDQADVSEGFINFIGTNRGVILGTANSAASARIELNGTVYRIALYGDA